MACRALAFSTTTFPSSLVIVILLECVRASQFASATTEGGASPTASEVPKSMDSRRFVHVMFRWSDPAHEAYVAEPLRIARLNRIHSFESTDVPKRLLHATFLTGKVS